MHVVGNTVFTAILLTKCLKADFHLELSAKIATTVEQKLKSYTQIDVTTNSDG